MRVVIDTNVLVSAVLKDRLPERVILWCVGRLDVEWLVSVPILEEYAAVIRRPKFALPEGIAARWMELVAGSTVLVAVDRIVDFPRDRKDAPFLACALAGGADALVTGDRDFDAAMPVEGAHILGVRAFATSVGIDTAEATG